MKSLQVIQKTPVLKRVQKYYDLMMKQEDLVSDFLKAKSEKKTSLETCYLLLFGFSDFEDVYVTVSGNRKVVFTVSPLVELVKAYDQAESQLSQSLADGGNEEVFFTFFEDFVADFHKCLHDHFYTILMHSDPYSDRYYAGNFFAEEVRKFLGVIIDSQTRTGHHFIFQMIESLAEYRRKIAFKAYEKYFKVLCKQEIVQPDYFHAFARSYGAMYPKLRRSYRHKMLKLLGSQLSKIIGEPRNIKTFEGIFAF
jgi:hypothetical protein